MFRQSIQSMIDRKSVFPDNQEGPYIVVLSSVDRIQEEYTPIRQGAANTANADGTYTDDNAALGNTIRDNRYAKFQVNWSSVLPKKHQKFRVSSHFMCDDIIRVLGTLPPGHPRFTQQGGVYNTSDGNLYYERDGKFIKVYTNLFSGNQFDTSTDGRSGLLTIASRFNSQEVLNNEFFHKYGFENTHSYLFQPIVEYPQQDLFEVRLCGSDNNLIKPESFLQYDYEVQIQQPNDINGDPLVDADGNPLYNRDVTDLPIMCDWYLVLGFTPCQ